MGTYDQQRQHVEQQINVAQLHVTLPPQLLLAISESEQQEDLAVAVLNTKKWEPDSVFIPAGEFIMGSEEKDDISKFETPSFTFHLPAYRIGKYPVTNAEYARFVLEKEYLPVAPELAWENGHQPAPEQYNLPVKGVSWYDALAYCLWLFEQTERPYTLPSEAQWEMAARGLSGALFPWGDDWHRGKFCNVDNRRVTQVDAYQEGASPFGCCDMVGNLREWTTTFWGRYRRRKLDERSTYPWGMPWKPNEGPDVLTANRQVRRVTRGGTSFIPGEKLRAARRTSELPYRRGLANSRIGFRIALNLEE